MLLSGAFGRRGVLTFLPTPGPQTFNLSAAAPHRREGRAPATARVSLASRASRGGIGLPPRPLTSAHRVWVWVHHDVWYERQGRSPNYPQYSASSTLNAAAFSDPTPWRQLLGLLRGQSLEPPAFLHSRRHPICRADFGRRTVFLAAATALSRPPQPMVGGTGVQEFDGLVKIDPLLV
jgi:hypothetical protein